MRKFYAFILAALMVVGLGAAVHAEDGVADTYGGYQVITVLNDVGFSNGSAMTDAYCPDETWRVTGGGYYIEGTARARVIDNRDMDGAPGNTADFWHVAAFADFGVTLPGTARLHVRAVCTKLG